jgi:hypothetical protein
MAQSQAPSSCIKSTVDGVPRFVLVRPSIVSLLSRIGRAEDFLFAFVLVWLACTLSFILGLPSLGSSVAFSAATSIATIGLYISYGTQFQHLKCPSFVYTNHLITHRNPHRPPRHLRGSIYTRTVPPWQVLAPNRDRRRALDRFYIDCLLPPGAQPGQLTNAQLRARRSRDRPYLRPGVLGYKRPEVVRGTYQAGRRCARSLLLFR